MGNSLSYDTQNQEDFESLKFLNFYSENSTFDSSIGSTSLLTLGISNSESYNIWDFKNFGLPKQAVKWAYKSINDSRIYEKPEMDPSFYSYGGESNSLPCLDFKNKDSSLLENYNSEWSLLSNNSSFTNSKSFANLKFIELLADKSPANNLNNLELNEGNYSVKSLPPTSFFEKFTSLNKASKVNSVDLNDKLFLFDSSTSTNLSSKFSSFFSNFRKPSSSVESVVVNPLSSEYSNLNYLISRYSQEGVTKWPSFYRYAELDFKREEDSELLEEMY